jgi:GT2 family glycosyltransferase
LPYWDGSGAHAVDGWGGNGRGVSESKAQGGVGAARATAICRRLDAAMNARDRVDLSVVIPCLDAAEVLAGQLEALRAQQWRGSWDVIVADNGSTDDTRTVAEKFRPVLDIRVVDASDRAGRQHACNVGARAGGRAVVFVDADDEVAPGYIAAMGEALAQHAIVAARIDHVTLNDGWVVDGRSGAQTNALQNHLGFLPFGSGGTLGVRADVFEAVGGFASDMHYAEDIDFCWRAQLAGYDIGFVPDAVLRYRYRTRLRSMFTQHRKFGRASALLYRTYRDRGMPRFGTQSMLREWRQVATGLLLVRGRGDAARWARRMGRDVGRLQGSARFRVWFP